MRNGAEQILEAMSGIRPAYIDAAAVPDSSRQAQRRFRHWRLAAACLAALAVTAAVPVVYEAVRRQPAGGTVQIEPPYYVQAMQEYMTAVNGRPCDYDFTGMGKDLDIEIDCCDAQYGDYHISVCAVAGDAFRLFLFADITSDSLPETPDIFAPKISLTLAEKLPNGCWLPADSQAENRTLLGAESTDGKTLERCCFVFAPCFGTDFTDAEMKLDVSVYREIDSRLPCSAESEPFTVDYAAKPQYLPAEDVLCFDHDNGITKSILAGRNDASRDEIRVTEEYAEEDFQFRCAAVSPFGVLLLRNTPEMFDPDAWLADCNPNEPRAAGTECFAPKDSQTIAKRPVLEALELCAADRSGNSRTVTLTDRAYRATRQYDASWAAVQDYMLLEFQEPLDLADTAYLTLNGCRFVNAN